MTAVCAAYLVSRRAGGVPLMTIILAGVAISSLAGAIGALLMIRSDPDLRPVLSWLLGGFSSAQWIHSILMLCYLLPSIGIISLYSRILNVFQLPDDHVKQIGVNVERTKLILIAASSLITSAAVSFSGLIGFVGLIAPHTARLIVGVDYRKIVPFSMLIGSGFLVISDLAARTLVSPGELPVGIVTAFCGAPFFLYLLRKRQVRM
jgi:iron complex transport system permease protein